MNTGIRPNEGEHLFLTVAYNRFYDLFDEIFSDEFWEKDSYYRFSKIKDCLAVYSEIYLYEPIKHHIKELETARPPGEALIAKEYLRFIRNLLLHFPFYNNWNAVVLNKTLVNWIREGERIDRFLTEHEDQHEIKYRIWQEHKKKFIYSTIRFPRGYTEGRDVKLSDMLPEREGMVFAVVLMRRVLDSQVVE